MHPYDEEHVIGIGRDTKEIDNGRVQQLGIKIALFNVADVKNPIIADDIIVGDSSTHSEALYEHKSFFFDKKVEYYQYQLAKMLKVLGEFQAPRSLQQITIVGVDSMYLI